RAADQGTELIRRLLAFARKQKLEPSPIDLARLEEALSDLLAHTLGGLVHVEWRTGKHVWNPFADQAQLELALLNLIINARDAMPAGGTVTVTTENAKAGADHWAGLPQGDYVVLSVSDTGVGISPELMDKVMEPFFTTKEVGKGSGLGLSMVYGFAKQSGGAFRLTSELGQGTTGELWLPRASGEADSVSRIAKEPQPEILPALQVLLVDDHDEVRSTTAAMLEDLGHKVVEASNGAEAIGALKDGACKFDVLISDYAMPNCSGTDFLREARELCPGVPAVIITGYVDADVIGDRPEGVEVIPKPFSLHKLQAALARVHESSAVAD
ncbi:MAG TPA: ATP-binding protein, partial [Sphingomicrobium sp.]|nr:ATP-binding protein [Sphingomicrobium sp.]